MFACALAFGVDLFCEDAVSSPSNIQPPRPNSENENSSEDSDNADRLGKIPLRSFPQGDVLFAGAKTMIETSISMHFNAFQMSVLL